MKNIFGFILIVCLFLLIPGCGSETSSERIIDSVKVESTPVTEAKPENPNSWTSLDKMNSPRSAHGTISVKGKIYVIGGGRYENRQWVTVNSVEEYDPETGKWATKADMITPRGSFGIASVNEKIYVIGGVAVVNGLEVDYSCVEEYDPAIDKWTAKKSMPTARQQVGAAAVDGKIYVLGGDSGNEYSFEVYDPQKDVWIQNEPLPFPVRNPGITTLDGKIYIIGGHHGEGKMVAQYDPAKNIWTRKQDLKTPRTDLAAAALGEKIYTFGGLAEYGFLNTVEEYDVASDSWTTKTYMTFSRSLLGAAAAGDKIYISGGTADLSSSLDTFEAYTP